MNPRELRIGNYVLEANAHLSTVTEIRKNHIVCKFGKKYYKILNEMISPVALTEEWLIKFRFERVEESLQIVYHKDFISVYKQDNIFWYDLQNSTIEIQYVHQLQNLYFTLTNIEL